MGNPRTLFVYFYSFQIILKNITVDFSGIWTRIVAVEGEYADHLAPTTAHLFQYLFNGIFNRNISFGD